VRAILSRRDELGRAGQGHGIYDKWQGAHWVLANLAQLGYPEGDDALLALRDRVLEHWLHPDYYREFEARTKADGHRGPGVPVMEGRYRRCASQQGNALLSMTVLGLEDERADALVERLLHWQWPDGGWNCDKNPSADTSSFMETLLPTIALASYGKSHGSAAALGAARRASEVFLRRRMFRRISNGKVIHPSFTVLHFPRYWHYDVLGGLRAMALVGRIKDTRCAEALDLVESKRLPDGGWPAGERYYKVRPGKVEHNADYVDWGPTGSKRMNEWVTVDALSVLRAAGRLEL
jgi:hypothetical protein